MTLRKTLPDFETIFEAAATHLVEVGPDKFSVCEIAESLNVSSELLTPVFNDLYSFATSFGRFIDGAVVQDVPTRSDDDAALDNEPAKDRVFEVLMSRFDALEPYKEAVRVLASVKDPKFGAIITVQLPHSMGLMLSLSGVAVTGFKKPLQVAGLIGIWLRTVRVWLKDDSEDMAKTMASLDKSLKDADSLARRLF